MWACRTVSKPCSVFCAYVYTTYSMASKILECCAWNVVLSFDFIHQSVYWRLFFFGNKLLNPLGHFGFGMICWGIAAIIGWFIFGTTVLVRRKSENDWRFHTCWRRRCSRVPSQSCRCCLGRIVLSGSWVRGVLSKHSWKGRRAVGGSWVHRFRRFCSANWFHKFSFLT